MVLLLIILLNIILVGTFYSLIWTLFLFIKHSKKCKKQAKELINKSKPVQLTAILTTLTLAIISIILTPIPAAIPLIIAPILFYYLFITIKTVELVTFEKTIPSKNLTEGDWISKDIIINNKVVYKKSSPGVSKKQIELIKQHLKQVPIKEGIPFIPTFLFAIIVSLIYGNVLTYLILW